ncbi:hypothetical protein [Blautia wexlerae]|uniref:hypothetical protein n=1 Tax=Blautia wexlerae TaxID=418240 RepID=UPI00156FFDF5|nr:hypothetical protein [Blautia wexlerae]NSF40800.1 hypothetical protein [Blautia wexlerae]
MNKIVEAVKEGRKIETKDLFSVVNDFCLTRLAVKTSDGDSVVSMQVNKCEDRKDEYELSQSCIGFDDVSYHLKKDDIISAEGEFNTDADTLYITCKLKNELTVYLMIINVSGSENRTEMSMMRWMYMN